MKQSRFPRFVRAAALALLICATALPGTTQPADAGWPRQYSSGTANIVVYRPQVDQWNDFKVLRGRCAFALTSAPGREAVYGTFRFQGDTLVDPDRRVVLLRNVRPFDMRFPSAPNDSTAQLSGLAAKLLPTDALVISLDRLLAFVQAGQVPHKEARVLTNPPPIFYSTQPAVLVIIDGDPVMIDTKDGAMRRVVNTNWDLYQDKRTSAYYLRHADSWLTAPNLQAAFAPASNAPAELERLSPAARAPRVTGTIAQEPNSSS